MAIITLTTDLGSKDFYQAALKGSIVTLLPTVNIVDITHDISAFNIPHAAFVLKNALKTIVDSTKSHVKKNNSGKGKSINIKI